MFAGLDKVGTEIQGLSRSWNFILKFNDFQGACDPCTKVLLSRNNSKAHTKETTSCNSFSFLS